MGLNKYLTPTFFFFNGIKPNIGDAWRDDELWVNIREDMKYLFALMDDETRFWIAQEVVNSKFKHDARSLFKIGKEGG